MSDPMEKKLPPDARDEATRVRQGKPIGAMRWVLGVSLFAVVVAFIVAYWVMPLP